MTTPHDIEQEIVIRKASGEAELRAAAQIKGSTEPWITLGRTPEMIYPNLMFPELEVYVAVAGEEVVGVISIALPIPVLKGYIGGLAVASEWRNRGIGASLLKIAEERIFGESPNVFICVSSFNPGAQRFYYRHGYELVGELKNFTLAGHGELLIRKTIGPWASFKPADAAG